MLEELGLGEAPSREEADVVVFNTCTIREKPDTKFAAYIGDALAQKRRRPDTVIAVGGCYAEAQRERLFSLYPDVDVAFGPGSIPHLGEWLGAGGFGVARRASASPRSGSSPRRCRCTASAASRRGCRSRWAATRNAPTASSPPCAAERSRRRPGEILAEVRGSPPKASSEITLLGQNVNSWGRELGTEFGELLRACDAVDGIERIRFTSPAPEGLPPAGDRGDGGVRSSLRAHAPAAPVGLDAHPQGDAAHVLARALPAPRRRAARGDPRSRARRPTSSSASRARPRTTSARRSRSSRRSATTAPSRSSTRRGRGPRRPRCRTRSRTR